MRLLVEEDGVYRLTSDDMRGAGLNASPLEVTNLALSRQGEPVPYLIHDDSLIFFGQAPRSRYTSSQAYVLRSGQPGAAMAQQEATPAGPLLGSVQRTLSFQENWEYVADARLEDLDEPWFWQTLPLQGEVSVSLAVPHPSGGAGRLHLHFYGASHHPLEDPDHTLAVILNASSKRDTVSWDGQIPYTATVTLAPGSLVDGANDLVLAKSPQEFLDIVKLDRIRLDYDALPIAVDDHLAFSSAAGQVRLSGFRGTPLLINVTDPEAPLVLTGWEDSGDGALFGLQEAARVVATGPGGFLRPAGIKPLRDAGWRSPQHQADLIVITTDELAPGLAPLIAAREEQGLAVAAVAAEEIYDEFGGGMATPDSINQFLRYASSEWSEPRPRYVLLVGDATSDFRGYLASRPENPVQPPRNVIPPYLVPVNYSGETVSDARLADVDGDGRPDLAIGRWPVDDLASVRGLVQRTLAYESTPAADLALFTSDGSSAEFSNLNERLLAGTALPGGSVQKLDGVPGEDVTTAWNQGAWLVTYAGHGSLQLWGKDSIFSTEAVSSLASAPRAPIVLQLTCLTGLFAHPEIVSLSERLITQEGGPVLTIAATSLTLSSHQEPFAAAFLQALEDPTITRIGDALQVAKAGLDVNNNGLREISDTFGLLGDPSALLVRP
ncbi:MAG: C25 family cysteine peptidase [Anaerolineae bacterium]|nr:C25 family cysteine peptidase [Anaerolineae bacterium]